jgi:predicted amidohydrolase YtcJ
MVPNFTDPLVKMKGRKFYADGSIQLGTGFMRDQYKNAEYGRGFPNYTKESLTREVKKADDEGWQVGIHTNGDAGIDLVLDAFE